MEIRNIRRRKMIVRFRIYHLGVFCRSLLGIDDLGKDAPRSKMFDESTLSFCAARADFGTIAI